MMILRFSHAGSRPVELPAEYQSLFTAGVAPRLGEYAGLSHRYRVLGRKARRLSPEIP